MNRISVSALLFCIVAASIFWAGMARAATYDYYVDQDQDEQGDGTKNHPFATIGEAIAKALDGSKDKRKINVKSGKYAESVVLGKDVEIYGSGIGETIISGAVRMKDGARMERLSVEASVSIAVTAEADASIVIKHAEIRGFKKIGLMSEAGRGKIFVANSRIHRGEGKGVYIQTGGEIEFLSNRITGNKEEGIDLRDHLTGVIQGNTISENGESGIELIVGSSEMTITKNSITKNGSSGIATQFYELAKKNGKIVMSGNEISGNKKYGVDCNTPSGGAPAAGYWQASLDLKENSIEKSGIKSINPFCRIIRVVEEKEEVDNRIHENPVPAEVTKEKVIVDEEALRREEEIWQRAEHLVAEGRSAEERVEELKRTMEKRGALRRFFFGENLEHLFALQFEISQATERMESLRGSIAQSQNLESDEDMQYSLNEEGRRIEEWKAVLSERKNRRSVFGWLAKLWMKI